MKLKFLFPLISAIILFSSCGIITKTRYGNGLKLNIESNLFSKKSKSEIAANEKRKNSKKVTIKTPENTPQTADVTVIDSTSSVLASNTIQQDVKFAPEPKENLTTPKVEIFSGRGKRTKNTTHQPKIIKEKTEETKKPMDQLAAASGWLYYGSLVGNIILSLSNISIPILSTIFSLAAVLGLILAIIAYSNIRRNGYEKRGAGLALSIILINLIAIVITLIIIALFLATF